MKNMDDFQHYRRLTIIALKLKDINHGNNKL